MMTTYNPFCICLQETHFKPNETFNLRGYTSFRKDVIPDQRARGGVSIFLREGLPSRLVTVNTNLQVVAVQIEVPLQITICNIYLPNFDWDKRDLLKITSQLPVPFLLLGDFNAHSPIWGSDTTDRRGAIMEEFIDESNLVLLNTGEATRFNARTGEFSHIDLTLSSPRQSLNFSWKPLDDLHYSDHFPIIIHTGSKLIERNSPKKYVLTKADWVSYKESIQTPLIAADLHSAVNDLTNMITSAADNSIPSSSGHPSRAGVPWWNNDVKTAIANKKKAFNIFKRYPTQENLINFKRFWAISRKTILASKKESWQQYVSSITSDTTTAEVWRKVRNIAGKKFPTSSYALRVNNNLITSPVDISQTLAEHFQSASSTAQFSAIFQENKQILETHLDFNTINLLNYNDPFTMQELEHALNEAGNSAPGLDLIAFEMLRQLPVNTKEYLLELYNRMWLQGTYPSQWKEAIIVPMLKEGKDPLDPTSYRPLSMTCCPGKIMEKMANNRLVWLLETSNFLSSYQMGFRKYRSTADQLTFLETSILNSFSCRSHLVAVFFDLEKAYDMTWRHNILKKLHEWGIRGNLPMFIKSFLEDRKFRVRVGNVVSPLYSLENGVPQGSTLSVTLFAIAVNELVDSIGDPISKSLYVDDLVIFYTNDSMIEINRVLQTGIDRLVNKVDSLGFRFSPTKTACMHFCRLRKQHEEPQLLIKNTPIEVKSTVKCLGLIFDSKLTWGPHIKDLASRCKKSLNLLRCVSNINWGADREVLLQLYKSLIQSKLDYGCTIYSSSRRSHLKSLETIHYTGIRLATGAFRTTPVTALCCESGIAPLEFRRKQLLLNYSIRVWAQPNHPLHALIFDEELLENYDMRPTISRPTGIRVQEAIRHFTIELPPVLPLGVCEVPPWRISCPNILLECTAYQKKEQPGSLFRTKFFEILDRFQDATVIYTDGSKCISGVGSAFYVDGNTHSWTLPSACSIFTAELYAIWQALLYCNYIKGPLFLICSDSLTTLESLRNPFNREPQVQRILALLHSVATDNKDVHFVWTPAHVGITGNEAADQAAKRAAEENIDEDIAICSKDLKATIRGLIKDQWQNEWNRTDTKLKQVKPMVDSWRTPTKVSKREEVALTRLRLGHTHLTSSYLLIGGRPPRCDHCGVILTVHHIILECAHFTVIRQKLQLPNTIRYSF